MIKSRNPKVAAIIEASGFLQERGAWGLVDGQFGSTGKGLAAAVLADAIHPFSTPDVVTTNGGPNSGHTAYGYDGEKIVLRHLPTYSVMRDKFHGYPPLTYINSGAILDPDVLWEEIENHRLRDVFISPMAAVVTKEGAEAEKVLIDRSGSTAKGTGAALAAKVLRQPNSVLNDHKHWQLEFEILGAKIRHGMPDTGKVLHALLEVSQGFSLSLNASGMFPYVTSRDCTIGQAMSDAGLHPSTYKGCMMVVRTFPIRIAGNSGPCYPDQREISWDELGVEPEITTVTKKVRRVFTWSNAQFREALMANRPEYLFVNFMNYIRTKKEQQLFLDNLLEQYWDVMNERPRLLLLGYGPKISDVVVG